MHDSAARPREIPLLDYVIAELEKRRGHYKKIAKKMSPRRWRSYYSWLTKLVQGKIADPGVRKIQALADRFRADPDWLLEP